MSAYKHPIETVCDYLLISAVMMTSSNGNIFRVTDPLCGEFTGPGDFPHKDKWRGALMFFFICVWINGWVSNREAGDLRRHRGHYDVNVMCYFYPHCWWIDCWFQISDRIPYFSLWYNKVCLCMHSHNVALTEIIYFVIQYWYFAVLSYKRLLLSNRFVILVKAIIDTGSSYTSNTSSIHNRKKTSKYKSLENDT